MSYSHGELWRDLDGKVALFDRDWSGHEGRFVKRLHAPEGRTGDVGSGWRFEPAAGLDAEIAASNGIKPTASGAAIPSIRDLVARGVIQPAPKSAAVSISRSQSPTPQANDEHGRHMARLARTAVNSKAAPAIDTAAIYESRRKASESWDRVIEKEKQRM